MSKSLLSLLILLLSGSAGFAQMFDYNYHRTYRYSAGGWTSPETYFTDISDNGVLSGYFKNAAGNYSGLVYQQSGKAITYDYPGYNNTEITGVNASGYVVGRAYNSPADAIVWRGNIGADTLFGITEVTWYYTGATFQNPKGMNAEGVISGSIQTGTSRWLNNVSAIPPVVMSDTKRFNVGATYYNTYGLGISDAANDNISAGFYLSGSENKPFLFTPVTNTFHGYVHRDPSLGIPGTKFNDVNNSTHLAVSYKSSTGGIWQGTVGSADVVFNTVVYDLTFPFTGPQGSAVLGINNHDDIAGWFKKDDTVTAYYALVTENKIPGYEIPDYTFNFSNGDEGFEKTLLYNDDPWLLNGAQFYNWFIEPIPWVSDSEKLELQAGHRYPDWVQYVIGATPDSSYYEDETGNFYPTPDALGNWLSVSTPDYHGFCYGMSVFALQYRSDKAKLQDRFGAYLSYFPDYPYLYPASGSLFINLIDVIAALYQYQNNYPLDDFNNIWDYRIENFQSGSSLAQFDTLKSELNSLSEHFYKPLSQDSVRLMSIWFSEAPIGTPFEGSHSIVPYKLNRLASLTQHIDTVYAFDPNKPGVHMKVLVDYDAHTIKLLNASNTAVAVLGTIMVSETLAQIQLEDAMELSFRPAHPSGPLAAQAKTAGGNHSVKMNAALNYTIQNAADPSQQFQQTGDISVNDYPGVHRRFREDDGPKPIAVVKDGLLNIKSSITGSDDFISWNYGYPAGNMIYARHDTQPTDQDLVWNNSNFMQAANPDGTDRFISLSSIAVSGTEQTLLITDSLMLGSSDTLSLTATDHKHFLLTNGNSGISHYDLHVRFAGGGKHIMRNLQDIELTALTNHTIVVQPDEGATQQVIILVDHLQDGTIDDTLYVTTGPVNIRQTEPLNGGFRIYPNPVRKELTIAHPATKGNWNFRILDASGRVLTSGKAVGTEYKLDTRGWAAGVYFVEINDDRNRSIGRLRFIKQ